MIIIEGTDAVGKTSTIKELKKSNIICYDRSKDVISKYMLEDYSMDFRARKYHDYLKKTDCMVIFLINNDNEELMRRVYSRSEISEFDLDTCKYNKLYQDTYNYMKENNMLEDKLFMVDVTNLNIEEQVNEVKNLIIEKYK
ncbi:MAG: hypothetical protein NC483_03885 [Ruminococcus sp.]|nr:hypothetical protein [Ruminococcus sp.]